MWAWGDGLYHVGETGLLEDATAHVPRSSPREVVVDRAGAVWVRGPGGVATRDPRTGAWTRDGRPYTNQQVADPTIKVARLRPSEHVVLSEAVPGGSASSIE